ncbi:MAG: excinuclease ABC subunit UvrA, partial [Deltaproteobacteria bacterium]|nr:excinuclease ABC subunit UvrA [Deltaproteobacteria bacterium]
MADIIVRGARMHNLKNIDVTIPRNKLVVITGLSGSGKSSLAFDTIYAEGQRRYVESVSAYARQFLEQMEKPDVDEIIGLSPAIAIEQRTSSRNPRSTVGTSTEIYDYLRVLFARAGRPHCYVCGRPITAQTVSQMIDQVLDLPEGTKFTVFAPIIRGRKGEYGKELQKLARQGFIRVNIDGELKELGSPIQLDKKKKHDIDLYIDRLTVSSKIKTRLADSLELALKQSEGLVKIIFDQALKNGDRELLLSEKHACIECGVSYPEINPQLFSFNNPRGACAECDGLGTRRYFDPDLVVPNRNLSLREGAILPWQSKTSLYNMEISETLAKHYGFEIRTPFADLSAEIQKVILYGSGSEELTFVYEGAGERRRFRSTFEGVIPSLERRWKETTSPDIREDIEKFMNLRPCPSCRGARLRKESLSIKIGGQNISEVCALSIREATPFFDHLKLTKKEAAIADKVLKEIRKRLTFLIDVGLDYLSLDRSSASLSGGEDQRIRLATQIGSALTGVLYVLDEPSIGLHQRDNFRLLRTLMKLRDLDNTVLVVEHDRDTMMAADHIIDLGPGAGVHGGHIVAEGTAKEIIKNPASLTGQYLSGKKKITPNTIRRPYTNGEIRIMGASEHNLKNIDVSIPVGVLTCITGVSGSGKSTLINETLLQGLLQRIEYSKEPAGKALDITGWEKFDKIIDIDQSPIGRTPRSNPATYTGIFTFIRDLFSGLPESKARGYGPGRFSFNVKGGRCEACEGDGVIRIEMHFLPDVHVECEVCNGKRFNRETLEILYKGKSIADVLSMTIAEAQKFFVSIPNIRHKLETLIEVGMSYVELGQSATTLSGGEAQRIKLSRELSRRSTERTLYILDEPTTGLHFDDVQKLLDVLTRLVDQGSTVIIIEHNLDVIK